MLKRFRHFDAAAENELSSRCPGVEDAAVESQDAMVALGSQPGGQASRLLVETLRKKAVKVEDKLALHMWDKVRGIRCDDAVSSAGHALESTLVYLRDVHRDVRNACE